ncbi:MAG: 1-deoxy-D-xylulose-5-phosphate synthase, partial [Zoogloea sp.]
LIHDIALQNLPVMMAIDRAGLVGADGATHHGAFDISYLLCVPNLTIFCPADENECRQMLYTAYQHDGPTAVRYPRGSGLGVTPQAVMQTLPIGKGEVRRNGNRTALLAFGSMLGTALQVGEELDATVANMRFAKPIDRDLILRLADTHDLLVSLEENATIGGAGSEIARVLHEAGKPTRLLQIGLPDRFIDHGDQAQLMAEIGLNAQAIRQRIEEAYQPNS